LPALAQVSKQGFVFVLDRRDGRPLFPVEERASAGQHGGRERAWPTHTYSDASAAAAAPRGVTPDDRGVSRSGTGVAAAMPSRHCATKAFFTPVSEQPTLHFPGSLGGANWGGGAYLPQRQLLIVQRQCRALRRAADRGGRGTATRQDHPERGQSGRCS